MADLPIGDLVGKPLEGFQVVTMWGLVDEKGEVLDLHPQQSSLKGVLGLMDEGVLCEQFVLTNGERSYVLSPKTFVARR